MATLNIKLDLLKLKHASVAAVKGNTETKFCIIIPIDDADLYQGEKGVYLNCTAFETKEQKYGNTHFIKQDLSKDARKNMTDEEIKAQPILGSIKEQERKTMQPTCEAQLDEDFSNGLPF